jgi:putative phage-type endonuclease
VSIEIIADLDEIGTDSEEWHRLRLGGLGGSDAGVVAGVSTWRSPYDLWSEKVAGVLPDPSDEKEYQRWGKLLEDPIAEEFATRTGIEVHRFARMVRNTDYPFMFANVDRLTGPANNLDGVLEIKTTRFADQWADGQVPLTYGVQGQHYLAVLGLPVVHYACLIGGQELVITTVERNETLIADLVAIEEAFWQSVVAREAPPADGSESTRKALQRRWRPDPDKMVELIDCADLIARRHFIIDAIKVAKEEVDEIDATIMETMGDAEVATINGEKVVTWKGSTRNTIDTKALKEAHPALAAEFVKTTEVRTLRYTAVKEESHD